MGLLKDKKILVDTDFTKDVFFAENTYLKALSKSTLPTVSSDIELRSSQPIFYSINNALNRLVQNDKFIEKYLQMFKDQSESISQDRVVEAFKQNITNVNSTKYQEMSSSHYSEFHQGSKYVSLSSIQDSCMLADFSNFDESLVKRNFLVGGDDLQTNGNACLCNDFVVDVEFDDSTNSSSNLMASVCNRKTGNVFKYVINGSETEDMTDEIPSLLQVPYIYKRWLSGLKEIFVYLPTTFTFYNEGYGRVDLVGKSKNLNDRATWIQLKLNRRHFSFKHIYQVQICPQSLPMQIHNNSSDYPYFSDILQPSIVRSLPMSLSSDSNVDFLYSDTTNYYIMYFTCYGTDSQAIRIFGD